MQHPSQERPSFPFEPLGDLGDIGDFGGLAVYPHAVKKPENPLAESPQAR
jgi:hypothetical protein